MSQQKVDQKKYDRVHRKSLVRKKKIEETMSIICVAVIGLFIVGWIGFSIYTKIQAAAAENVTYEYYDIDTTAIEDYFSTLNN
ncbi:hypothetical protein [Pseudobutyrivibrio sp. MD2005]|uniref:hypothetical protein n=1 Tax=Pseudobutyrivibrio sp. MD2005 TaxID=1410616 RepID=UPI00047F2F40|nr:hypothetical protein [Pseudobutyrivibrio sp. MD2005]